ncbi:MAG: FHA domain-containing protein [Planctomycetes bacterium]|nr:FHA domain-containing protein [Planctomycetota bacterium]
MEPREDAQPTAKVVFRSGPLRGNVLALEKDRTSIGRDERNDVAIHDDIVSSFHAAIVRVDGEHWLEDAGSKNGTFLNGERIERAQLKDGDVFCLCQAGPELQFTLGAPSLPTVLESTTATFSRTRSLVLALRELLPGRSTGRKLLSLTGVRKLLDYRLVEATRRERIFSLCLCGVFLLLCTGALVTTVIVVRGAGRGDPGAATPAPVPAGDLRGAPPARAAKAAVAIEPRLEPIYGGLFLAYRVEPVGEAVLANRGEEALSGCLLELRFEDASRLLVEPCLVPVPELAPGASVRMPLLPKLSTEILSAQTREVTAALLVTRGGEVLAKELRAVFIHGRHVFNWEKPERVAAFVDQNDPAVRELMKTVWDQRPATSRDEFPPPKLAGAVTLLTGLAHFGLRYLQDAANPISEVIDGKANDSVSYPGETLLGRSGDCDDLSVLCCAVLEAARIPAAFAVGSGHVFFLFDCGVAAEDLPDSPLDPATVHVWRGRVWIPVEATELAQPGASFGAAWAAAWRHAPALAAGEVRVVDLEEAWKTYQPMNAPPDPQTRAQIATIQRVREGLDERVRAALDGLKSLFRENLSKRVAEVAIGMDEGPARDQAVGRLYARSGLFDEARRVLERAVFGEEGPPQGSALRDWGRKLTEDAAVLLSDLALCVTLGADSASDYDSAVRYGELAVEGFSTAAPREKGELMLRLGLVHRLRGDLAAERSWTSKAFALDPGLEATYRRLVASSGPVAGPAEAIREFLRLGLRAAGRR